MWPLRFRIPDQKSQKAISSFELVDNNDDEDSQDEREDQPEYTDWIDQDGSESRTSDIGDQESLSNEEVNEDSSIPNAKRSSLEEAGPSYNRFQTFRTNTEAYQGPAREPLSVWSATSKNVTLEPQFSLTPETGSEKSTSWVDLSLYAMERGFTITSTTGGKHNPGSMHYRGRAIDIRTWDHSNSEVGAFILEARADGLRVKDERTRPEGQKVWSGAHLHLEVPYQMPAHQGSLYTHEERSQFYSALRTTQTPQAENADLTVNRSHSDHANDMRAINDPSTIMRFFLGF